MQKPGTLLAVPVVLSGGGSGVTGFRQVVTAVAQPSAPPADPYTDPDERAPEPRHIIQTPQKLEQDRV